MLYTVQKVQLEHDSLEYMNTLGRKGDPDIVLPGKNQGQSGRIYDIAIVLPGQFEWQPQIYNTLSLR
jgi:hypothetical protein